MDSTVFLTVLSGTLVFLLGQLVLKFLLEPIKDYKGVVGEIDNLLKFRSDILQNSPSDRIPGDVIMETYRAVRKASCDFESRYKQIPLKGLLSIIGAIPPAEIASRTAATLMRTANITASRGGLHISRLMEDIEMLRKDLKIEEL